MTPAQDAASFAWPPLTPAEYLEDELVFCRRRLVAQGRDVLPGTVRRQLPGGGRGVKCESCPEEFTPDEIGCQCDGHIRCMACLVDCPSCAADIRDSMAAEAAEEWRLQ